MWQCDLHRVLLGWAPPYACHPWWGGTPPGLQSEDEAQRAAVVVSGIPVQEMEAARAEALPRRGP